MTKEDLALLSPNLREHGARTKKKRREEPTIHSGSSSPSRRAAARAAAGPRGRRWIRPVIRTGLALRLRGRGRFVRGARSFCLALDLAIGRPPRGAARIVRQTAVRGCARPTAVRRRADRRTEQGREPGGREERIRRFRGRYREFYMSRMFVLHVPCYATPCCSNPHVTSARGKLGLAWRNRKHLSNPLHSISDGTVKDNGSVRRLRPWLRRKTLRCVRRLFEKRWLGDQEVQRWHTHLGSHPRRRLLSQGLGRNQRLVREKFTAR